MRDYIVSETGCGLNIGLVHKVVAAHGNQEAEVWGVGGGKGGSMRIQNCSMINLAPREHKVVS